MIEFFSGPRLIDGILCLVVLEFVALQLYRRSTGRGPGALDLLFNLLAGAFLLLAVRAALSGAARIWLLVWLSAALLAHLGDLLRRWRG